jgi:hypothetical protein
VSSSSPQPPYPQDRPADAPPVPSAPPYAGPPPAPGPAAYQAPYANAYERIAFAPAGAVVEHPQATLAFVLGLLSVLGLLILGPFGWYFGRKVVREIDQDGRRFGNRGLAVAGMWLGVVGTIFLVFVVGAIVVGIALFMAAART